MNISGKLPLIVLAGMDSLMTVHVPFGEIAATLLLGLTKVVSHSCSSATATADSSIIVGCSVYRWLAVAGAVMLMPPCPSCRALTPSLDPPARPLPCA
jgi:hypothetical protein